MPDGKPASGVSGAAADAEFGSSVDEDEDFGSADVYDFDLVNKNTVLQLEYPWRTVGKMFFDTGGGSGYCSASVIGPNNAIVTAAHCCYNRLAGDFYDNFAFVPAMRKAGRPYGTFPYSTVTVLTAYALGGARQDDVCVLNLSPNEVGQSVSNVTGWLGRSWDGPTVQHRFAFGYPSNIKNGKFAAECTAEGYASCGSNLVNGMGCRMTYGSSGGPWLHTHKKFVAGANNFVDSVVSGWDSCTGTFGQSFNGPRFTSQNIKILCDAAGC